MSWIEIERDGEVAILRLARPPVNAFNLAFVDEAAAAAARLRDAADVAAMVLTGAGAHFSAGLDLKEVPFYGAEDQRAMVAKSNRAMLDLYAFPKPVVAAVNGSAIAGGLVFALACDLRVGTTAPSCKIGLTEVRAGIPFPAVALALVRAELSPPAARRLLLTGRNVGPGAGPLRAGSAGARARRRPCGGPECGAGPRGTRAPPRPSGRPSRAPGRGSSACRRGSACARRRRSRPARLRRPARAGSARRRGS